MFFGYHPIIVESCIDFTVKTNYFHDEVNGKYAVGDN